MGRQRTYSILQSDTTLTQFNVEVTINNNSEEFVYQVFSDPSGGDPIGPTGINWLREDNPDDEIDDNFNVEQVKFNQDMFDDFFITECVQRRYGSGVSYKDGRVLIDNLEYDFLPDSVVSVPQGVDDGDYTSIEDGLTDTGVDIVIV